MIYIKNMIVHPICGLITAICFLVLPFGQSGATAKASVIQISDYDVVVFGATPGGISAAIAAARHHRKVALIATGIHIGGLMSSGLSITDIRFLNGFGGIFKEFIDRTRNYYISRYGQNSQQSEDSNNGLWFEPHVAEAIFEEMIAAEKNIVVLRNCELRSVLKTGQTVDGLVINDRTTEQEKTLRAVVTIDATYEGDVAAGAGAGYRIGREARSEFKEPYAGKVFLKNPGLQILPGSTGEGDERIQAYNYRLCMTMLPELRAPIKKPSNYRREDFSALVEPIRRGETGNFQDVIRLAPIPNNKYSANNSTVVRSLDLPEDNYEYPNASQARRAQIVQRYKDYTLGLLWFLQNDSDLPEVFRQGANLWGLCNDEFTDNNYVPYELYIREARRIKGQQTFTAFDAFPQPESERAPIHSDSVAVADYHVDSHLVQRQKAGFPQYEGHVYLRALSKPSQVPYGIMIPQKIEGLLVPGAVSATHLGFGVLRMEPVWMALGQAAGTAAALAAEQKVAPSKLSIPTLQKVLLSDGQVITFFHDLPGPDPVWLQLNRPAERSRMTISSDIPAPRYSPGIEFFGARGFFNSYYARPYDPVTRSEAVRWLTMFARSEGMMLNAAPFKQRLSDLSKTSPDYKYVAGLMNAGIIENWAETDGFFGSAAVSRVDAVRWITRIKQKTDKTAYLNQTSSDSARKDLPIGNSDFEYFQILRAKSALPASWLKPERLQPLYYITREEFCDILLAVYGAKEELN